MQNKYMVLIRSGNLEKKRIKGKLQILQNMTVKNRLPWKRQG